LPHPGLETSALGLANLLADDQPWSLPEQRGKQRGAVGMEPKEILDLWILYDFMGIRQGEAMGFQ